MSKATQISPVRKIKKRRRKKKRRRRKRKKRRRMRRIKDEKEERFHPTGTLAKTGSKQLKLADQIP